MPAAESGTKQGGEDHLLVRTVKAVIEGQADDDELEKILQESRHALQQYEQEFTACVEELGAEVRERCYPLVDSGYELFEQFQLALDKISRYLEDGDQNHLYSGGSLASRAAYQMNLLFMELRNSALAARGPTEIPTLNLLLWLFQEWQKDPGRWKERFRGTVESERFMALGALRDLEESPQTPACVALKEAFDQHLRCMNRMAMAMDQGRSGDVPAEIEKAKETFQRIREIIPVAQVSTRLDHPTGSPEVNLVLSLARDVEESRLQETILLQALDRLKANFQQTREQFAALAKGKVESVLVHEEIERTEEAHDLQEQAIGEFYEFFESRQVGVLRSAASKLEESANRLYKCYENFQSIADREGKVPCVRCSHYNPVQRHNCEKCGAPLPVKAGTETSTFSAAEAGPTPGNSMGPVVTENLLKVYEAVNAVDAGQISMEEFLEVVSWFEGLVRTYSRSAPEVPELDLDELSEEDQETLSEEDQETAHRLMEELERLFREGVEHIETAISCWRSYAQSGERGELEDGVRWCDQGARALEQVRQSTAPQPAAPKTEEPSGGGEGFGTSLA
ncbi:MAG: hypothetical protein HY319_24420 [Armatimonadetes bacterium]|nr:hypothetical protein [Armatimonadota bacterium]